MKRSTLALALVLVTALSAALRLTDPGHGLPADPEPDIYVVRHVERLRAEGFGDRYLAGWKYPLLFGAVTAALPWEAPDPPREAPLAEHLEAAGTSHLWVRRVVAAVSIFAAPLTLLFALRFLGLGGATLAALLVATSGLHTWLSVQARPHAPTATLVLLSLIASARWIERPSAARALLAGLTAGVAGAALHSGLVAGLSFGAAGLVVLARERGRALAPTAVAGVLALACVVWAYGLEPHEPRDWHVREAAILESGPLGDKHVVFGGHILRNDLFNGSGFRILGQAFADLDPVLGVLTILGALTFALALVRPGMRRGWNGPGLLVGLVTFVPFTLVFGLYELTFDRFFLPIYPLFAILGAGALVALGQALRLPPRARWIAGGAVVLFPLFVAGRIAWLVTRPTTHDLVAAAVTERLDATGGSAALIEVPSLPDWAPADFLTLVPPTHPNRWLTYQARRAAEWGSVPPGVDATLLVPAERVVAFNPEGRRAALAELLAGTERTVFALATSWQSPVAEAMRQPEVDDWRGAFADAGWVRTHVVAPVDRTPSEGTVPWLDLPSLLGRTAIGHRYEIYERSSEATPR